MTRRIEDYALIGNMRTAALVARDGSLDWLCVPRFDSPACFAALLGDASNGRWQIAPAEEPRAVRRRYLDGTAVLETTFETDAGVVRLTDFMALTGGDALYLVRVVSGVRGTVPMRLEVTFRFDYGRIVPWVRRQPDGLRAVAGPDALMLRTPLDLQGRGRSTVAEFTVHAGQSVSSVLTWHHSFGEPAPPRDGRVLLDETVKRWRRWSGRCKAPEQWQAPVVRSAITLKLLTHEPTGAIIAAPTTSLPERIGGVRNWDYRFGWLRDATFTLYAMMACGYGEEARAWRHWLERAVAGEPSELQIMYGVAGERRLDEWEVPWLAGFDGSRPVRIGNDAYRQYQLDVYGELMDALHYARDQGLEQDEEAWRIQRELLGWLEGHWRDPNCGFWEMRSEPKRFTHSCVMAWVAMDRAVKAVERFGLEGPAEKWRALRDQIREEVLREGFNAERNAFVQTLGGSTLDASALLMPLVGFIDASDPRMLGTVEAIMRELTVDGFVRRYPADNAEDGLPHGDATFLACSFWLADNLALAGRVREARHLYERILDLGNDVGLLSEEYDPVRRCQLGNFPQAFSHVGVINTARNLAHAEGESHGPAAHRAGAGDRQGG